MRVAIVYAVVAWLVIQVADTTFEGFGIPIWAFRLVMLCVILGFPLALILAWAFELTPDGIKTTNAAQAARGDAPVSEKQQRKRNWFSLLFAAFVPTLIFGTLAIFFYIRSPAPPGLSSSNGPAPRPASLQVEDLDKSIAVLPLENLSPDPQNAFFADGVQEDILTHLSKIQGLSVIGRTSTRQYRDTVKLLDQIGEELDVRYLIEGSVRRAGDQVRVTVQLIDAHSQEHLWAENYDRPLGDIFAIQSEVAKTIASKLQTVISPEESARIEQVPTRNLEAYDFYVRGREITTTKAGVRQSREFFQKALEMEPDFAQAHIGMAFYYSNMVMHSFMAPHEAMPKAQQWVNSAKALPNHESADFYRISGVINIWYNWDWEAAERDLHKAVAMSRESMPLIALALYYLVAGNAEKAIDLGEEAAALDPFNHVPVKGDSYPSITERRNATTRLSLYLSLFSIGTRHTAKPIVIFLSSIGNWDGMTRRLNMEKKRLNCREAAGGPCPPWH